MYFNSIDFLVFFAVVYSLYLILNHRWQNRMLLAASYFFYGYWDWRFLSLLAISTVVDYYCGLRIHESESRSLKKRFLALSVFCNLGLLGTFKYFGFFSESFAALMQSLGLQVNPVTLNIVLPVGISFYTFQTMSYTIDIYRGHMKPTRSFRDFALFVSFFPQLVAGPIERARKLLPQIQRERTLNPKQIHEGVFLIGWGLFKKIIIADNVANIVNITYANYQSAGFWDIFLAISAFYIQLYCDFSAYSDIARGLAKMMGMELMVNFKTPFLSRTPADFWARWHISLTTWVRDYVFVPIGANKKGTVRTHINLLITLTLIGLWHGAAWTFVLWGFYFGVAQVVHRLLQPVMARLVPARTPTAKAIVHWASVFLMYLVVLGSGYFFRATDLHHTMGLLKATGREFLPDAEAGRTFMLLTAFSWPLFAMQALQYRTKDLLAFMKFKPMTRFIWCLAAVFMIFYIYLLGANVKGGEEFIYFQF